MIETTEEDGQTVESLLEDRIFVFIESYSPTEAERELAKEHGTDIFRNAMFPSAPEPHLYAVAVDPSFIKEGFRTYDEYLADVGAAEPAKPPVTSLNPAAGNTPPWTPGTKALASDSDDTGEE